MKLLITGGFGYLGSRVAQFMASQSGDEVFLGSRQQVEAPSWLSMAQVVQTQWDTPARLEEICNGIDAIVHLAGMNAQDCADDPVSALEVNAVATARLLRAAIRQGVKRFIYLSTAHVYGSPLKGVINEATCPVSIHAYSTSHRAGEDVVRAAHHNREIEGIVIRLSNAFGAPVHADADCWMLLVNDLCHQAVTTQRMVLRTSGLQRRDFITLNDVCRAIKHFLELPADKLSDGLFNVGGAWSPTILEMTQLIADRFLLTMDKKPEIVRNTQHNAETTEFLSFEIEKLLSSGFSLGESENVNRELDSLIRFCIKLAP